MSQSVADMTKTVEYVVELHTGDGWQVASVHGGDVKAAISEARRHYPEGARKSGIPNIWSAVRLRNVGAE